jgi:hypothetical protein
VDRTWIAFGAMPYGLRPRLVDRVRLRADLFFKGEIKVIEEPRDRRFADRNLLLCKPDTEFRQGDVRLLSNPLLDLLLVPDAARPATKPSRIEAMRAKIKAGGHDSPYTLRKQLPERGSGRSRRPAGSARVLVARLRKCACRVGHGLHRSRPPQARTHADAAGSIGEGTTPA